jgi:hypothetical protein
MRYTALADLGFRTGGGSTNGRFLTWHPQGSRDGTRPAKSWSLRNTGEGLESTALPSQGMIVDLPALRAGWELNLGRAGIPPERRWNPTPCQYEPQPGPDWKRCVSVPVALQSGSGLISAIWEQASLAARIALDDLRKLVLGAVSDEDDLPFVRHTGTRSIQTGGGGTAVPIFELVRFVPRPSVLPVQVITSSPPEVVVRTSPTRRRSAPPPTGMIDDKVLSSRHLSVIKAIDMLG